MIKVTELMKFNFQLLCVVVVHSYITDKVHVSYAPVPHYGITLCNLLIYYENRARSTNPTNIVKIKKNAKTRKT